MTDDNSMVIKATHVIKGSIGVVQHALQSFSTRERTIKSTMHQLSPRVRVDFDKQVHLQKKIIFSREHNCYEFKDIEGFDYSTQCINESSLMSKAINTLSKKVSRTMRSHRVSRKDIMYKLQSLCCIFDSVYRGERIEQPAGVSKKIKWRVRSASIEHPTTD